MAVLVFDVPPPLVLPFLQAEFTVTEEVTVEKWVKTDLPEPIMQEPEESEEPAKSIAFAVRKGGKVIGSLRRADIYDEYLDRKTLRRK